MTANDRAPPHGQNVTLWILVAIAGLASFAGILTIGIFTMPMVYGGAILLLVRPDRTRGVAIMLCAMAAPPVFVAWLNRGGPGLVCHSDPPYGIACGTQLNPWPWLGGAAASLAIATVLFLHARRRDATKKSGTT